MKMAEKQKLLVTVQIRFLHTIHISHLVIANVQKTSLVAELPLQLPLNALTCARSHVKSTFTLRITAPFFAETGCL